MSLIIRGITIIDATGAPPLPDAAILIEDGRIREIGPQASIRGRAGVQELDGTGQFAIPGLLDANVHLLCDIRPEILIRFRDRYEDLIVEAAQIALRSGLTTVFDTWGPRRFLTRVRDRIAKGEVIGSRIFCAGNIVGFDGPFSADFVGKAPELLGSAIVRKINAIWAENVGRHLMWLSPEAVDAEVGRYIGKGIDFVKYASNEHLGSSAGALLAFSAEAQRAIVTRTHAAGLTAQAHTMSVEGLRVALEAGCDLIQHANLTGPVEIPEATLTLFAERQTGAVVFPFTPRAHAWIMSHVSNAQRTMWRASDANVDRLIASGAPILMATDGGLFASDIAGDPAYGSSSGRIPWDEDNLFKLGSGHFAWLSAMELKGLAPMAILQAATRNVARAYGRGAQLGTLEPGKIADLLLLDADPLAAAANYRRIRHVIKDGVCIDRDALPEQPILSASSDPPEPEEADYVAPLAGALPFPGFAMCRHG